MLECSKRQGDSSSGQDWKKNSSRRDAITKIWIAWVQGRYSPTASCRLELISLDDFGNFPSVVEGNFPLTTRWFPPVGGADAHPTACLRDRLLRPSSPSTTTVRRSLLIDRLYLVYLKFPSLPPFLPSPPFPSSPQSPSSPILGTTRTVTKAKEKKAVHVPTIHRVNATVQVELKQRKSTFIPLSFCEEGKLCYKFLQSEHVLCVCVT